MTFKLGDVVIGQNNLVTTRFNGMEGEIAGGLALRPGVRPDGSVMFSINYLVLWANGEKTHARPNYIRRKPSRSDDVWADEQVGKLLDPQNLPEVMP